LDKDDIAVLLREADEIVAGSVRLFGDEPVKLQLTFNDVLYHWTDYETGKASIPKTPFEDIKFLWEPARFGWAFILGRAYFVSGIEKYAEAFWKYFEIFTEGNPPYFGPNWMNGQEVGIRLMAFAWAEEAFKGAVSSTAARNKMLVHSIAMHAARIPPTLVYARSQNNNHLIIEAAALFSAGTKLNEPNWRDLGWTWLNIGLRRQISSYGEYIQHSTNYHRLMLQAALWVDAIIRRRGKQWTSGTYESLVRASHWLFSMIDPTTGQTPNLGANDGSLLLPLSLSKFNDFRPTVQAAARAFLRTGLPPGIWDEMSLWLGLSPSKRTSDSNAYITDHLRAKNSWGFLRATRFKSRLSHMDQLHFDLWWRGLNFAKDAGTYLYNAGIPWDNPLVSTQVHNTITIDGKDQMTRGGRFLTLDWFPAYSKSVLEADENILGRILSYHKGYSRLGIRHERTATAFTDERWEVKDRIVYTKPGEHICRLHWLLMDGEWELEPRNLGYGIKVMSPYGWVTLRLTPDPRLSNNESQLIVVRSSSLVHGNDQIRPFEGWVSPTYGQKIPAISVTLEITSLKTFSVISEFIFPK
jgi:hypothetical protein